MKNLFVAIIALLLPFAASAQFSVSGKVTNQNGEVLPGATVSIASAQQNTVTDASGQYKVNLATGTYAVVVNYIGYQQTTKSIAVRGNQTLNFSLLPSNYTTEEVTVTATRASKNSPTAFTNLSKKDLEKNNFGQDLPFLLNQTPSVVVTSDAGAGVGYTGIRIRGSDPSRINVTINGIPYNDSESQGSFFVDIPDIASSVNNIQVQRGVGTSTNGAGAFGGSINVQTATRRDTAYAELNNSAGSFNTVKNTVSVGTGLLGNHFSFDGRLSRIHSDGYVDRAFSNLKSYFLSGAYYGKNTTVRANVFTGYERTYQAWNGVPDYEILNNRKYNEYTYKDQVDNYTQNHYQLLVDQRISDKLSFSGALHYTKGKGYYEEFKEADSVKNYGLTPVIYGADTLSTSDIVRRRWLDNDFYGVTYALKYLPTDQLNMTLGGAYNEYKGGHYGNIINSSNTINVPYNYEYYRDDAKKNDFNIFARAEWNLDKWLLYADMQYRYIYYSFFGFDRNLNNVQQSATLNFFNPKAGVTYKINDQSNVYASFAVGNREPNRDDYTNSSPQSRPKHENLKDFEAGYRIATPRFTGGINGFYMLYNNQLIVTGQLNDVGSAIRRNVKDSYRAGVEFDGRVKITDQLAWGATATVSTNKIKNYGQFFTNYDDNSLVELQLKKTTIAFSPSFIGSSEISYSPIKGGEIALLSKYISSQFLDNTMNTNPAGYTVDDESALNPYAANRRISGYFVNDVRLRYNFSTKAVKNIGIGLLVNNVLNKKYEASGATYPGLSGSNIYNYNYYYVQATRNFLASLSLAF
ncbi:TonB-dependent receptor [Mucilaginibacter sp. UR6-1]|uniref:TonB-dependent receptor n=1 Tax=Mucilaginibacter sp. UR6-1 TaxID=1435643 RepID=UPI001E44AA76|nr:TonB-dependent receptor [Mucilaginibacter sp. UR6-1]MCC8410455.1 TonB-dependent receptor [Mucilaginibacter sp. UR6-1]